ncbi:MAG: hypothetical protein M1825_005808 [Sarcosagium campestre]|nr:MAG: hypothetical protein M1825_005808 [Sarcosagium campestre]
MGAFTYLVTTVAPLFITVSPITSYSDQIYAIHRSRSSAGFSLDIPLIMLVASILRYNPSAPSASYARIPLTFLHSIFYYFEHPFATSLLLQAVLMIIMQLALLHTALRFLTPDLTQHQPFHGLSPKNATTVPFTTSTSPSSSSSLSTIFSRRPYNFWRWKRPRPYFSTLAYLTLSLMGLHSLPLPAFYGPLLGYLALGIEATLPLPQMLSNARKRSCKGFRLSVLASWLVGDALKMIFFMSSGTTRGTGSGHAAAEAIPLAFKLCGGFQALCDVGLGLQYLWYGDGEADVQEKDVRLA